MDFKNLPYRPQIRAVGHIVNSIETGSPQGMLGALNQMLNGGLGKTVLRLFGDHCAAPTVIELLGRVDAIPGVDHKYMLDRVNSMVHLEHATDLQVFIEMFIALTIFRRHIHSGMDRDEASNIAAIHIQNTVGVHRNGYEKYTLKISGQTKKYIFEGIDQCYEECFKKEEKAATA